MSDEKEELADNQARVLEMISDRKERLEEIRALEEPLRNLLKEWQVDTAVAIEVCISKAAAQKFLEVEVPTYRIVSPASGIGKALRSMGLAPAYDYIRERLDYLNDLAIEIERIPPRHLGHRQDSQGQPGSTTPVQQVKTSAHLTSAQVRDYKEHAYKTEARIDIPGEVPKGRSNCIYINKTKVRLADNLLCVLLRLVEELEKGEGGWITLATLHNAELIEGPNDFRKFNEISRSMRVGQLPKEVVEKVIENKSFQTNFGSRAARRISTHPKFVTYEKRRLIEHGNKKIRETAERLPDCKWG